MNAFEIHITTKDLQADQIHQFESFCHSIAAKPILIELSKGKYYRQPMISKVLQCKDPTQLATAVSEIKNDFLSHGYPILRTKIEVPMWQQKGMTGYFQDLSKTYFEWHGKVKLSKEALIYQICEKHSARLSRNVLKNDSTTKFITIRDYSTEANTQRRIERLKQNLLEHQIRIVKEEFEFCIFDSNESLDKDWI